MPMPATSAAAMPPAPDAGLVEAFKGAMRRHAAGVTIVTGGDGEARRGLTATAVCSVSMDPPMILACLNKHGEALAAIRASGAFCVNLLSADDEAAALRFAGQGDGAEGMGAGKFAAFDWSVGSTGAPALDSAAARIDCRLTETVEAGSHVVIFGAVAAVRLDPSRGALAYFDRRFLTL